MNLHKNKYNILLACIASLFFSCDSSIITPVPSACDGEVIDQAGIYNTEEKTHKIILFEENSIHEWNYKLPEECEGTYTDFELVGCIATEDNVTIETCSYTPSGTRTRKAQEVTITIIEARTGHIIASQGFAGHIKECPETITNSTNEDIIGDDVKYDQVEEWLLGYLITE